MRRNRVTDRWGLRALFARRWSGCIAPWRGLLRLSLPPPPPPPPKCRCRRAPSGSWGWSRRRKRGVVAATRSRSTRRSISQAAGAKPYFKNFGSFPLDHMPRITATATITTSTVAPPQMCWLHLALRITSKCWLWRMRPIYETIIRRRRSPFQAPWC